MKRHVATLGLAAVLAFGGLAAAPAVGPQGGPAAIEVAGAAPSSSVKKAGDKAAELISGWVVPVLFAIVGVFTLIAMQQRSLGPGLVAILGGLLAGFFLIDPKGAQSMFEGIYSTIF